MAHYAELNENNEVIYVAYMDNEIITDENGNEIEQLGLDHLHTHHGADRKWVRTSYRGNFRNKYAGLGDTYREDLDMFISAQPFASWSLNETTGQWEAPVAQPELTEEQTNSETHFYFYTWNEENQSWDLIEIENPQPV